MSAKSDLFTRLQYLAEAVNLPVLIDQSIIETQHNGIANLLRKGLGIVAFNILEDFIKNKAVESLSLLSSTAIQFSNLTDQLQAAATSGALNALLFRASMEKREGGDWKALIQEEALKIHSTKNAAFEFSKYSLVSTNSNISPNEVEGMLLAFGIRGGWATLKTVSDKIGGGLPDLNQAYKNAAERRHNSAHSASFQYSYQWLENIKNEILAICAALDILLTGRCRLVGRDATKKMDAFDINEALNFRFLESSGQLYRETTIIGGRARKNWFVLRDAIDYLQPTLQSRNEFLIVLNPARRIEDWYL